MTTTEQTTCPECGYPTAEHVQQLNCVKATQNPTPRGLYDLPIFGWAWTEDAKDLRA